MDRLDYETRRSINPCKTQAAAAEDQELWTRNFVKQRATWRRGSSQNGRGQNGRGQVRMEGVRSEWKATATADVMFKRPKPDMRRRKTV